MELAKHGCLRGMSSLAHLTHRKGWWLSIWRLLAVVAAVSLMAPETRAADGAKFIADLSPWAMFLAADVIVKCVMIALAVSSVLVWSAWMAKLLQVAVAKRRVGGQLSMLIATETLETASLRIAGGRDPVSTMVHAASGEVARSDEGALPAQGLKERVTSHLDRIEAAGGRSMSRGTSLIATVGATAPFVGLFGTVWGIMNSFIGISKAQTTNLAVVAPGIAEALLATAIGLVAAIPAVIFYNQLARAIAGYKALLGDAAAAVERLVSRDLDRRAHGRPVRALDAAE